MLTYGSTFSGIGGLDLAVEHVFGARPLWHVEPDPYAAAVLRRHWPDVPNLQRIELVNATNAPRPTIICGGSPCQDISLAGRGAGIDGDRSGLWWELARVLRVLDPDVFVWENVAAAVARALPAVLRTLAALGFDAEWGTFRAADVGAPHIRDRIFLVAAQSRLSHADRLALRQEPQRKGARGSETGEPRHNGGSMVEVGDVSDAAGERLPGRTTTTGRQAGHGAGRDGGPMVDTDGARRELDGQQAAPTAGGGEPADAGGTVAYGDGDRLPRLRSGGLQHGERSALWHDAHRCCEAPRWPPARGDVDGWARWPGAVPGVRRGSYGLPRGVDARRRRARLRCLGNAVVPAQATKAIMILWDRLTTP